MIETTAFVLLQGPPALGAETLLADLVGRWPELSDATIHSASGGHASLDVAGAEVDIVVRNGSFVASGAPETDVGDSLWPGSARAVMTHGSHAIIAVAQQGGRTIDQMALTTKVTSSVLAVSDNVLGVYWPAAPQLISAVEFQRRAKSFPTLPIELWVDVALRPGDKSPTTTTSTMTAPTTTATTNGLRAFGLREIEVVDAPECPRAVVARLRRLTSQILRQGRNITAGATLEYGTAWRVAVDIGPSQLGSDSEVSQLVFEPATNRAIVDAARAAAS